MDTNGEKCNTGFWRLTESSQVGFRGGASKEEGEEGREGGSNGPKSGSTGVQGVEGSAKLNSLSIRVFVSEFPSLTRFGLRFDSDGMKLNRRVAVSTSSPLARVRDERLTNCAL